MNERTKENLKKMLKRPPETKCQGVFYSIRSFPSIVFSHSLSSLALTFAGSGLLIKR